MFGVDAGEVQMSEPTIEEHLETKALLKIWDELQQDVIKKLITSIHICALASTLVADTLNIHCKGLPFNQW